MNLSELTQPYREVCDCCHKEIIAFKSEDGKIRYRCPHCGTMTVKSFKSRNDIAEKVYRKEYELYNQLSGEEAEANELADIWDEAYDRLHCPYA